jgi:FG-GAP repeat
MRSSRALTVPRVLAAVALIVLVALALAQGVASAGRSHLALPLAGARPLASPAPVPGETLMGQAGAESRYATGIAVSADGTTAIVGAPRADANRGAVTIYVRSPSGWTEQTELTGEDLPEKGGSHQCVEEPGEEAGECGFGRSVALSADGNTAIVGAPQENGYEGAVWVFVRSGSTWTLQGEPLTPGETAGHSHFGTSVALSADGNTALVGAPAANIDRGAAWVFTRSGATWAPQGPPLEAAGQEVAVGHFGRSVALSADGDTALVGAPGNEQGAGAAWLFDRTGETWTKEPFQELNVNKEGEHGAGHFGAAVALSADGDTALVGAHEDTEGTGAAWTFTRTGLFFASTGQELTGGEPGAGLGAAVALSADGHTALIGAPYAASGRGAAVELTRSTDEWSQAELAISGETGGGHAGASVALSQDASVLLVGAPRDNQKTGALWSFFASEEGGKGKGEPEPGGGTETTSDQANTNTTGSGGPGGAPHSGALALITVGPPVLGVSGNIALLSGHVYVKLPGSATFVPLTGLRQVPFGTIVDATHGKVKVTTATPSGHTQVIVFYAGEFKLTQNRNGLVIATLVGGNFSACPTRRERLHIASFLSADAFAARASRKHVVRKLWAEGHGKYETKGNYASGAVQGTRWLTEDFCDGTLIHVATDRVLVVNLVTHRHRSVKAPHNYLAKAP